MGTGELMSRLARCVRSGVTVCLFLLSFLSNLRAQRGAVTLPRNLIQLTSRSVTIVRGHVTYARVAAHPQYHNLSSVVVAISVQDVLKGTAGKTLTFRQFIWDPRDRADRAGYREGDELLLFLNPVTAAGFTSPVGLEQGRFRVLRGADSEPVVVNGAQNTLLLQGAEGLSVAPGLSARAKRILVARSQGEGGPIPLDVLRELVQTTIRRSGDVR